MVRYGKKSKLVVILKNIKQEKKLDAKTYIVKIIDKELFDFWQEVMEEYGYAYVIDRAPLHMGVASVRRRQLEKHDWKGFGPGTWSLCSPDLNPIENVWHMLTCTVRKQDPLLKTEVELTRFY
jgi:hypothetical protein